MPCAGAVIRDGEGRLLLIRRATEPSKGCWSLPGGRVEPGESAAEAAAREVHEETGLVVTVGAELACVTLGSYLVRDFAATAIGGRLRAGDDADDVRWVAPEAIDDLALTPGLAAELRRMGALDA